MGTLSPISTTRRYGIDDAAAAGLAGPAANASLAVWLRARAPGSVEEECPWSRPVQPT